MSDKITYKIEDIIIEISMGPFGSDIKTDCFTDSGVPLLDGSNITRFKLVEDKFKFVSVEKSNQLKKANAKRGDVVVTHRGTLGQISYIPEDSKYDKYLISQSQFRVCFKDEIVNPAYMVYYFHTKEGQKKLLSFASYVGVPALAQATSNFRLLEVSLPDLLEQERIISFLDVIEQKIDLNTKINYELESLAKRIYDYWFLQFEFPNTNGKPYRSSGGKMVWSEELKREIPEGWGIESLSKIANITMGSSPPGDSINTETNGIIFYQGNADFGHRHPSVRTYTTQPVRFAEEDDILLSVRAPVGELNITLTKCCIGRGVASLRSKQNIYLYYLLKSLFPAFDVYNNNGTTFGAIKKDTLGEMRVCLPPLKLRILYQDYLQSGELIIKNNSLQNKELASLRDFLLPLLMNGQVTFKEQEECPA